MNTQPAGATRSFGELLFGLYAWFVFGACVLFGFIVALVVPGHDRRCRWITGAVRAIFVLSGAEVEVSGLEHLPAEHCVVVANHASYLDGLFLKAYLPARFSFVVKGEMRENAFVHFLMHRAGSKFVERFESAGLARDARKIVKAAKGGESMAFFAEGTFRNHPGLGRFHAGAFVAAIRGHMPIVPAVIVGTREMMPGEPKLPRPVPIGIDILPAIMPDDPAFDDHKLLAETCRQRILEVLDEPDLCTQSTAEQTTENGDQL